MNSAQRRSLIKNAGIDLSGYISKDEIDKLNAISMAKQICERIKIRNGVAPNSNIGDIQQAKDRKWISHQKENRCGKGSGKWRPEVFDIFKSYKYEYLLEPIDGKAIAIKRAYAICERAKARGGSKPCQNADKMQMSDIFWIRSMTRARYEKIQDRIWHPEILDIFKIYGYQSWLELIDPKDGAIENAKSICERIKKNNGLKPSQLSGDPQEKSDAAWVTTYIQGKKKYSNEIFDVFHSYGYEYILIPQKDKMVNFAKEICERALRRGGAKPSRSNPQERKDSAWIAKFVMGTKNIKGGTNTYPEVVEVFKSYGYESWLEETNKKDLAIQKATELCERAKKRGGMKPRTNKPAEKNDLNYISKLKMGIQNMKGGNTPYPEVVEVFKSYGYESWLD